MDNDDDARFMLTVLLRQSNIEVTAAGTFAEGLVLARSGAFDLFLLDGMFADGSGLGLCRRIRGFDAHTPIAFFTGLIYEKDRQRGLAAGAQEYLVKPDDLGRLADTLWDLARHARQSLLR